MRKLKTADLFSLSKIIKKMNIKEDIKALTRSITGVPEEEKKKAAQDFQIDFLMLFVENVGNAEKEVYKLLGDLDGRAPKEIEEMEVDKFMQLVKELFGQENLGSFLSTALK